VPAFRGEARALGERRERERKRERGSEPFLATRFDRRSQKKTFFFFNFVFLLFA
jgi:hypothetical protein